MKRARTFSDVQLARAREVCRGEGRIAALYAVPLGEQGDYHLAALFAPHPDEETLRVRADYWDVWSTLFAEAFFRPLGAWCASHGLEYLVHLNHEDALPRLVRSEGDFFRPMRHVSGCSQSLTSPSHTA